MASIYKELAIGVTAEEAWAALRNVAQADKLFGPVLTGAELDGDTRTAHFANGMVVHERILDVDDARRRVAYSATDGPGMTYHHASMQIVDGTAGQCSFVWITDFVPETLRAQLTPLIDQGARALKANLERGSR